MRNQELQNYLESQIIQSPKRLLGLVKGIDGELMSKRSVFYELENYALGFLNKKEEPRIVVMPGLRGTGKTTLLAQLYLSLLNKGVSLMYLSVDEVVKRFSINLWDVMDNYEELLSKHIEGLDVPLILFLDEIHYDEKWAMFLKSLYDKTKKVMVFCTGSSALLLRQQINADVARRVHFVEIHPVNFSEYMLFKYKKEPLGDVGDQINKATLFSKDAAEIYDTFKKIETEVRRYWLDIDGFEVQRYLKFGTFPFTLKSENDVLSTSFIAQIINKVIYTDIPQINKFDFSTLDRIDKILYLISDTLGVSATKLSDTLSVTTDTVRLILKTLEESGLVTRISPFGTHFKQIRKASKYLFATPSLRYTYLSNKESTAVFENYQGNLFEDLVGMYLNRIIPKFGAFSLTYDVSEGGADFVISQGFKHIVMEVGMGKKSYSQVIQTTQKMAPKFTPKYSVVISDSDLDYSEQYNAVKIPLKYFLLI